MWVCLDDSDGWDDCDERNGSLVGDDDDDESDSGEHSCSDHCCCYHLHWHSEGDVESRCCNDFSNLMYHYNYDDEYRSIVMNGDGVR